MPAEAYNPYTHEAQAGGLQVIVQFRVYSETCLSEKEKDKR